MNFKFKWFPALQWNRSEILSGGSVFVIPANFPQSCWVLSRTVPEKKKTETFVIKYILILFIHHHTVELSVLRHSLGYLNQPSKAAFEIQMRQRQLQFMLRKVHAEEDTLYLIHYIIPCCLSPSFLNIHILNPTENQIIIPEDATYLSSHELMQVWKQVLCFWQHHHDSELGIKQQAHPIHDLQTNKKSTFTLPSLEITHIWL